ncbi:MULTISPECIES: hypothetical protein [Pontibacillus]|uniref:Uncharacterized protein n=1 Tax=Pontibacillus chungwhensis TaxID=265426 RepID=A0ABY8UTC3_9BACI|nr:MULTISPECIES: hypothetical protein [Pontibacillus]MCD5323176.1 hypothetical protein [Pontibacillus sp. HN14]WIF96563.1 hypothetical protein QNI29_12460 [Pontibacillus chungwhensis]
MRNKTWLLWFLWTFLSMLCSFFFFHWTIAVACFVAGVSIAGIELFHEFGEKN